MKDPLLLIIIIIIIIIYYYILFQQYFDGVIEYTLLVIYVDCDVCVRLIT